jgi:hypothetical protein
MTRRAWILLLSMAGTFAALRGSMALSPDADLNVAGYNIHHLFTGVVILTLCGIPLVLGVRSGRLSDWLTAGFAAGLTLALDEWVYLIATDGSNASYLLPISFWGGVIVVGAALLYTALLGRRRARSKER